SHTNPSAPVAMNDACQPQRSVIHGTRIGANSAPTLLPALKTPTANARSRFGNHSATVFTAPGKFADSPSPSSARAAPNAPAVRAKACDIAATLHTTIAPAKPVREPSRSMARPMKTMPTPYARLNHETIAPY